jgi:sulfur carrier protein ThiS
MKRMSRLLGWGMAFLVPMALLAADTNAALLSGKGAVKVNGRVVPQSSVVYAGDKIETANDATVTLTTSSSVTTLAANSSIFYQGTALQMVAGHVQVKADRSVQAFLGNLKITPAEKDARFQMRVEGQTLILAALHGPLTVTDGVHTMVLAEGEMMTRRNRDPEPAALWEARVPPAAALTSAGIPSGWVIVAIAAGVVGGVAAGIVAPSGSHPASSQSPYQP